jgi:hypothetical protein
MSQVRRSGELVHAQAITQLKIIPGMEVTVRGLRWSAGWEFDCPTAIISPTYRFFEDGCSLEHAVESVLIDACIDGVWKDHDASGWEWRGWPEKYLWNRFHHAKRTHTETIVERVRFVLDRDGDLWFETLSSKSWPVRYLAA